MTLPNLIIPGFQKCATSTLVNILKCHNQIYTGETKEPHFFSKDRKYELGLTEYTKYYLNYSNEKYIVDGSQSYITSPYAIDRISTMLGDDVKFIIVIRNPIDRVISSFNHFKFNGFREKRKIEDLLPKELQSCTLVELLKYEKEEILKSLKKGNLVSSNDTWLKYYFPFSYFYDSIYSIHIKKYLKYYEQKNFLFLTFEEVTKQDNLLKNKLSKFLEIPIEGFPNEYIYSNKSLRYKKSYYGKLEYFKPLLKKLLPFKIKQNIILMKEKFLMEKNNEKFLDDTYIKLLNLYQEEIKELEKLTNLTLDSYKL